MEWNKPWVSFVIPTFNRAHLIFKAIESVRKQEHYSWELIVVDDGSTDNTREVVSQFTDNRIKYIKTENRERGAARNLGIKMSVGRFVSFIDSDDYILPMTVGKAIEVCSRHPEWDIFHFSFEIHSTEGATLAKAEPLPPLTNTILKHKNVIGCQGVFIRREVLLLHPFSELKELSGTEDYELWLRLAARFPIHHIPEVTSVLVQHTGRSMEETDVAKIEKRILAFLRSAIADQTVRQFIGTGLKDFQSDRLSYISLHAALVGNRRLSIYYLKSYLKRSPLKIFSKRTWSILFNLWRVHQSNH